MVKVFFIILSTLVFQALATEFVFNPYSNLDYDSPTSYDLTVHEDKTSTDSRYSCACW